ncbi:hypothetical protein O181_083396 [Austropuccinia psidii MF-1]|uniref:Uncharacterized protein n=1 Tax=Austropuccinia psidii MF-1 TaxID=1389203 RepID=A0A9Q3FUH6_9BASI|nr:hypothetical protein [Austropuccinia psidii MF-1]
MGQITPILQHSQDASTAEVPFYQIPKGQEDDQYYEDALKCNNIRERPEGAKNKNRNRNKKEKSRFQIIESQFKRRGRPPSNVSSTTTSRSQSFSPSPIMAVDASEDSEASLSKPIISSDSLPSAT